MRTIIGTLALLAPIALSAQNATQCGRERWPVKILADSDARFVEVSPRPTTISALVDLPGAEGARPHAARLPLERTLVRVRAIVTHHRDQSEQTLALVAHLLGRIPLPRPSLLNGP